MADDLRFTARQRAALPGGVLDTRVRILKRAVPIAAGVTLAAVLALTLSAREEFSFLLSKDSVATSRDRLRISRATYRGDDSRGRPFTVSAGSAVQRSSATPVVELTQLEARMGLENGPARITAAAGRYDLLEETLTVERPVVDAAGGYALSTGQLAIDIGEQRAVSTTPVAGRTPLGTFEAARMEADVGGERIILSGGARLRIARSRAS